MLLQRIWCLGFVAAAAIVAPVSTGDSGIALARAVESEVLAIAGGPALWPGFDPRAIPLAVFTGTRTVLFRHPAPPAGFVPLAEAEGVHEAFHVFQRERHPTWQADEGSLFVYPFDDPSLLASRRVESAALARALAAPGPEECACQAGLALERRRARFAGMAPTFAAYERANELNEGLAAYVQLRARGETAIAIPAGEFAATAVRDRAYVIGPALALVLDRLRPGWPAELEADDGQTLETLLGAAASARAGAAACAFSGQELAVFEATARRDVAGLAATRTASRRSFDALPGWRLVVEVARDHPLWPNGFDPWNVERADGGVLHRRLLVLGNDSGELRMLDEEAADLEALTEASGAHPLFDGVRRATVAGLAEPRIERDGSRVTIRAAGCTANFAPAVARVDGRVVTLRLGVE